MFVCIPKHISWIQTQNKPSKHPYLNSPSKLKNSPNLISGLRGIEHPTTNINSYPLLFRAWKEFGKKGMINYILHTSPFSHTGHTTFRLHLPTPKQVLNTNTCTILQRKYLQSNHLYIFIISIKMGVTVSSYFLFL